MASLYMRAWNSDRSCRSLRPGSLSTMVCGTLLVTLDEVVMVWPPSMRVAVSVTSWSRLTTNEWRVRKDVGVLMRKG